MDFLLMGAGLVVGFSTLIVVHELGHFVMAKWNGVHVKVFSIGMGPYLVSFTIGKTIYVLSLIPIGGYVKMLGQDDLDVDPASTDDPEDYRKKTPGQKAAILAGGALFNLIFAFFAFTCCYWFGVRLPSTRVGEMEKDAPIAKAYILKADGTKERHPLQEGDKITSIDGIPMRSFTDILIHVGGSGTGRPLQLNIERRGEPFREPVLVDPVVDEERGTPTIGLYMYAERKSYEIGFTTEESVHVLSTIPGRPAELAGLRPGDQILTLDGEDIRRSRDLAQKVQSGDGRPQELKILREGKEEVLEIKAKKDEKSNKFQIGLVMISGRIKEVAEDSEAYEAGVRPGLFVSEIERKSDDAHMAFTLLDLQKSQELRVELPVKSRSSSGLVYETKVPYYAEVHYPNFVDALSVAWGDLIRHSINVFKVVKGLLTRQVSIGAVSGPLGIAQFLTAVSVEKDLLYYLWWLGFLSINLGVLQFVPIPILDGWHLVIIGIEKLKGSPVAPRVQAAFLWLGLVLIVCLMLVATSNDILRMFRPG